ncbi:ABC transporter permease subunit [Antribacter sp. KLBMP9083]|uniref:ABC transporter permease subunit n=1 Tax=Antribacter soli TaxID=2910976 RepID=A0AA41U681_9MICO|nr:ABC transporter permease subunit [Antribacter soli]MCF4120030.1 ABC transporter permease subunit [Antribacter soli]
MSATVTAPGGRPVSSRTAERVSVRPVTFVRVLRSEWIKFWTLRSTWWTLGATVVLMVGLALLFAMAISAIPADDTAAQEGMAAGGVVGPTIVTLGSEFAQLVVAVLGALVVTGEFSTGMIRSTFAAIPGRISALWAKLVVLLAVTAVVSAVGVALAYVATAGMLDDLGLPVDFGDADQVRALVGAVLYLMAVAAFSLGVGALLRHTAASIGVLMAVFFVLPIVFQIIVAASGADWAVDVNAYLPSVAGEQIMSGGPTQEGRLEPWTGFSVLAGYTAALLAAAAVSLKTRDA